MSRREVALLAALCGAQVLEVLGVTVVIVALPVIGTDLDLPAGQLQLVVSLYAVLYGALLLTCGRLADAIGRRRLLLAGLVVTVAGALVCALTGMGGVLLVGRAVQGLGGAMVTPAALALITTAFPAGPARRTAISAWTAAAAGGGALGFGAGGLLVEVAGWRGVFWLLAAVAALAAAAALALVPTDAPAPSHRRSLDPAGSITVVVALVLLVVGAGQLGPAGSTTTAVLLLSGAAALLVAFVATQRYGDEPLLGWAALTNASFTTSCAVALVNTATTSASGTLVALVAADVLGLRPAAVGLVLLPFSIMVVVGAGAGRWWLARPRWAGMATGLAVVAVSMAALAAATAAASVLAMAGAVALAGLGLSWAALTSTDAATAALPTGAQGTAAGGINTAAQIGTALGVAVLLTVAGALDDDLASGRGYALALLAAAITAGATALALAVRRPRFAVAG